MARVFISHAGGDGTVSAELRGWFADAGHEVFLDQDVRDGIALGEEWAARLHERLRWADVVCVLTRAYAESHWCTTEASIALWRGSRLLPVVAEPGVRHRLLGQFQHTDLTRDREGARTRLLEALGRLDATGGTGWPDDRSPFPGLQPFDVELRQAFFGRSPDVEKLVELLQSPAGRAEGAVRLVVGPSGCGKSSLVRAGLLPAMTEDPGWVTLPAFVPGSDPVTALVGALAAKADGFKLRPEPTTARSRCGTRRIRRNPGSSPGRTAVRANRSSSACRPTDAGCSPTTRVTTEAPCCGTSPTRRRHAGSGRTSTTKGSPLRPRTARSSSVPGRAGTSTASRSLCSPSGTCVTPMPRRSSPRRFPAIRGRSSRR